MKKTRFTKILSLIVCIVLIAAMALFTTGCNDNKPTDPPLSQSETAPTVLGEGETTFLFSVITLDGKRTAYEIHTDETTVGDALYKLNFIDGKDDGFVQTVNGNKLSFNTDNAYWAFYTDGSYASTGVYNTNITPNVHYAFKAERA